MCGFKNIQTNVRLANICHMTYNKCETYKQMWDIQMNVIQTIVRLTNKCDNYKQMWDLQTNARLTNKCETYKQMWDLQTNVRHTNKCVRHKPTHEQHRSKDPTKMSQTQTYTWTTFK